MVRITIPALILLGFTSCRAAAIQEVKASSAGYESYLSSTTARVRVPEADAFLTKCADDIRDACRRLDERAVAELRAATEAEGGKFKEPGPPDLDFYDAFRPYLVHSPAPNAATPGDDCAEITTRLFLEAECPEQVVAVLAHEFGHIRELHQVDLVVRRKSHTFAVGLIAVVGAAAAVLVNDPETPSF